MQLNMLCASDDRYCPLCGIMLTSLFEKNKGTDIIVYLLTEGLSRKNNEKLRTLAQSYNNRIEIKKCDMTILKDCPIRPGDHVSLSAYLRIISPLVLPNDLEKILYLDCDIVVNKRLDDLWKTDVRDYSAAVVIDAVIEDRGPRLKYKNADNYFNSGVMLINLRYWRQHQIAARCLEYIREYRDILDLWDQDALNYILHESVILLPLRYNFQTLGLYMDNVLSSEIADTIKQEPVIIHFNVPSKPWNWYLPYYPYMDKWNGYRKISLWKNCTNQLPIRIKITRFILSIFWRMKIKTRPMEIREEFKRLF